MILHILPHTSSKDPLRFPTGLLSHNTSILSPGRAPLAEPHPHKMRCKRLNAPQYCTALDETKGHGGTSSPTDSTQRKRKEIVTYNKSHPKTSIAINEPRLMVARSVMTRAIAVAQARPVTTSLQCQEERCQVQTARGVLVVFAVALHDRRIILITAGAAKPPGRNQAKDAQCHCGDHEREGKCAADMLTARRRNRLGREGRNGACDGVDDE